MVKNIDYLLIDGMNLAFRLYFKMPTLTSLSKESTNIIYGYLISLNKLYETYPSKKVFLCWDSKKSFRKEFCSDYKNNRTKIKDPSFPAFLEQVNKLKKKFPELNLPCYEVEGYEADDIIAYFSNILQGRIVIVSSDNDLYQLLKENVTIFNFKQEITPANFLRSYGFVHELYCLWKAITGCFSDNIKGIKGVGPKRTLDLFKECDFNVEKIYEKLDKMGVSAQFDKALQLVYLPYMDFSKLTLQEKKLLKISNKEQKLDRKNLKELLDSHNIKLNPDSFMRGF